MHIGILGEEKKSSHERRTCIQTNHDYDVKNLPKQINGLTIVS